jgi:hypothetical protein
MYIVKHYRHPVAGSFGQPDIPGDDAFKYLRSEEAPQVSRYLFGKCRSVIVHCQKNALDAQCRVNRSAQAHERIEQLGHAFQCQVLALNRNQNRVAGGERVQSQEVERRRAIYQNVRILFAYLMKCGFKAIFSILHRNQLNCGTN